MAVFSKRHYQAVSPRENTPDEARETVRLRWIGEQANREMMARFKLLTAENGQQAVDWQRARIQELSESGACAFDAITGDVLKPDG